MCVVFFCACACVFMCVDESSSNIRFPFFYVMLRYVYQNCEVNNFMNRVLSLNGYMRCDTAQDKSDRYTRRLGAIVRE